MLPKREVFLAGLLKVEVPPALERLGSLDDMDRFCELIFFCRREEISWLDSRTAELPTLIRLLDEFLSTTCQLNKKYPYIVR